MGDEVLGVVTKLRFKGNLRIIESSVLRKLVVEAYRDGKLTKGQTEKEQMKLGMQVANALTFW